MKTPLGVCLEPAAATPGAFSGVARVVFVVALVAAEGVPANDLAQQNLAARLRLVGHARPSWRAGRSPHHDTGGTTEMHYRTWLPALLAGLALALPAAAADLRAVADIKGCTDPNIAGTATLREHTSPEGIKEVTVELQIKGLTDGKHAVHIHETGACEPCGSAKGHHDPGPFGQTRPDSATDQQPAADINHPYHMGDLINIESKGGEAMMQHTTNRITLSPGRLSIFDADGSAFIVHTYEDTYCDQESDLKKGCAGGPRDACGVIRAAD
jgi:Cu-Zn family superoxide dismutase